jgi:hypothetical protein
VSDLLSITTKIANQQVGPNSNPAGVGGRVAVEIVVMRGGRKHIPKDIAGQIKSRPFKVLS